MVLFHRWVRWLASKPASAQGRIATLEYDAQALLPGPSKPASAQGRIATIMSGVVSEKELRPLLNPRPLKEGLRPV